VETWEIIVLALVALIILLAVGGAIARRRQLERSQGRFDENLAQVNRDLAAAHAEDNGWERSRLEDAARQAYASERGSDPAELELVQVIDRPGTDDDRAVFSCGPQARERLTLGRRDGQWVLEALE
jgi:membrane protein implicated in regulation of membrane protease activity